MNQRALIAAAAATVLSSMLVAVPAAAQEKEKCFGIAKMGQNDCANLSGSHSCAGQSKMDMGADEWKGERERGLSYSSEPVPVDLSGISSSSDAAYQSRLTDPLRVFPTLELDTATSASSARSFAT